MEKIKKLTPQLWESPESEMDGQGLMEFVFRLDKRQDLVQFARVGRGLAVELGRRWGMETLPKWSIHGKNEMAQGLWARLAGSLLTASGKKQNKLSSLLYQSEVRFGTLGPDQLAAWRECCSLVRLGIGGGEPLSQWRGDALFMSLANRMDWSKVDGAAAHAFAVACGRIAKVAYVEGDGGLAQWMGERGFPWSQDLAAVMAKECCLGSEHRTMWHADSASGELRAALSWAGKNGSAPSGELAACAWESLRPDLAEVLLAAGADVSKAGDVPARMLKTWEAIDKKARGLLPAGVAECRMDALARGSAAWEACAIGRAAPPPEPKGGRKLDGRI